MFIDAHAPLRPLVAFLFLCAVGCGGSDPAPEPSAPEVGPPDAIEVDEPSVPSLLREIAASVDPQVYPYANARRAADIAASAPPEAGPARYQALVRATHEWIRAGEPQRALDTLQEALKMLRASGTSVKQETHEYLLELQAMAGLRLGEQENCLAHHGSASCMFPIPELGVHAEERGSRMALPALAKLLEYQGPRHLHRVVGTGGSFGSSTLQLEVGLGAALAIEAIRVFWPGSGRRLEYEGVPLDAVVRLREDEALWELLEVEPIELAR